ncbi:MAG: FMN-binding protein [Ruminococcus sp.]|nr:FMN-binding protein [Ruminococcus sp.]
MGTFGIKLLNLLMAVAVILGYNVTLRNREQTETIAELEFELENQKFLTSQNQEQGETESKYQDGVYEGQAEGFGGMIAVQAVIENNMIAELNIVSAEHEDEAYLKAAAAVIDSMLEAQSAEADIVSGATFSSNGIIHAAEEALRKAEEAK